VFNIHNNHIWAWDNPQATCNHGYQVRLCQNLGWNLGTLSWAPYVTW
jgi:hypothetical protein